MCLTLDTLFDILIDYGFRSYERIYVASGLCIIFLVESTPVSGLSLSVYLRIVSATLVLLSARYSHAGVEASRHMKAEYDLLRAQLTAAERIGVDRHR
jgi:hypothetical protein